MKPHWGLVSDLWAPTPDPVSPGHAMSLHLHLPAGTYAEMCFFPDPMEGIPHALMGMVRRNYTWHTVAAHTVEVYRRAVTAPAGP